MECEDFLENYSLWNSLHYSNHITWNLVPLQYEIYWRDSARTEFWFQMFCHVTFLFIFFRFPKSLSLTFYAVQFLHLGIYLFIYLFISLQSLNYFPSLWVLNYEIDQVSSFLWVYHIFSFCLAAKTQNLMLDYVLLCRTKLPLYHTYSQKKFLNVSICPRYLH